jgi:dihydrofolate reductase
VSLIVAADEAELIGREGGLPWHISEDLKRFKAITAGHVVITGRRNQDDIVARLGHPLPGRTTIVVTRSPDTTDTDTVLYRGSLDEALVEASAREPEEVFVIGGAEIYAQAMPEVDTVYLTRVRGRHDGDTYLPSGWLGGFHRVSEDDRGDYAYEMWTRS